MTITPLPVVYVDGDTFSASDINATNTAVNVLSATQSLINAKGDILTGTAVDDTLGKTTVGANNTILTADSTQTNGVKWSSIFTGNVTGTSADSDLLNGVASSTSATASTIAKRDGFGTLSAEWVEAKYFYASDGSSQFWSSGTFTSIGDSCARVTNANTVYNQVVSTRAVYITSGGTLGTTASSRVFKENIVEYHDETNKLLTLNPVTFDFKDGILEEEEDRFNHFGLIAEDVHDAGLIHLVSYNAEGNPRAVDYTMISVELLGIVKKQQTAIDNLIARVQALETN